MNIHKKKSFEIKNQYDLKKKKNLPKILINFMKIHKKNFLQMKNQYMTQKKKSFENTHKLHTHSKTYLDVQNELAPFAIQTRGCSSPKVFLGWG